jgi:hypothetical protein
MFSNFIFSDNSLAYVENRRNRGLTRFHKRLLRWLSVGSVTEERWGSPTTISLPGGGKVGLYQPKHPTAIGREAGSTRTGF